MKPVFLDPINSIFLYYILFAQYSHNKFSPNYVQYLASPQEIKFKSGKSFVIDIHPNY